MLPLSVPDFVRGIKIQKLVTGTRFEPEQSALKIPRADELD